jgi:polyphosphate:AMP phosphotransferase
MFENDILLSGRISKKELKRQVPQLRVDLVNAQFDLDKADFSVIVVIAGDDRLGANRLYDRLCEWMDARFIETNIFVDGTDEEDQRPRFWRYWRVLPPAGRMGIFGGAWSLSALADRLNKSLNKKTFDERLEKINNFESDLADDGTLVLKFWVHLPPAELKKRLKNNSKDPDRSWWAEESDWEVFDKFRSAPKMVNYMLEKTNSAKAPWYVIDSSDDNFRDLTVAGILRDALQTRLAHPPKPIESERREQKFKDALGAVDLSQTLTKKQYEKQLAKHQRRLHELMRLAHEKGVSMVLAFEGWDAGGKGGAIRRLTSALPVRSYKLVPIAAPTSEEKARHYLWRFWRHMSAAGRAVIFDRTWYGRVTVERIEGFASGEEWQRAYSEINDFERQLRQRGILVLKFWMHISPEEQLARFQAREVTSYKKYKITDEDYRNRSKWDEYVLAINEMVAKTSTEHAPWHLVPANDKRFARIYVLKTVCDGLERILKAKK